VDLNQVVKKYAAELAAVAAAEDMEMACDTLVSRELVCELEHEE